ncbi:phytanoyl-CoA dioxygenase [Dinoroseobacter shibae DFL 12 = DSM 16493]|jgi:ectoine hydroxylase-related dioxygenase (phytanoyl-CoA dioxygenase family)|uniref:Phytanoyl-CoA dioxygenase n=1 Tax=Dinoroseobacter shibae (strain DSM 16493 / NCIMB 14021 / DFL 12) TaxID=398580 RepID=A8LIQ6_DINSH|nr:phytanoyl-CoA dioxygenase family protein [Dinoroseobacter shibae]ABV93020.1 phytanoyl-CoA dioxygenase [Dinoroseobacter shibae DFL 12 = DSM 16493]URF47952.1 phytanoyl-CoA dioxygenase family protein [Dinoroseobacter shibae]URF52261.1 phytanoyl-CoA dioxygenase family protein [Dinoroseobacter shibae]
MTTAQGYFEPGACDLPAFEALISQQLDPQRVPHAAEIASGIPVYDMTVRSGDLADGLARRALMAEWAWVLGAGPGVFVLRRALTDHAILDAVTARYLDIIAAEKSAGGPGADHFAAAGANDRIWNSLEKLCRADPELFALYFGTPALTAAAEAWLGPGFQMTAQINLVHPGGAAQTGHRDYHLGFQSADQAARYPAHVHALSPALTLQGGIAHCDMPVESGPTKLLPWSQQFPTGYLAFHDPAFGEVFERAHVQLPLAKGEALFFNPALFHAAGANRSADIHRMVNLLQVSSPFGRAMEALDRPAMCRALYPVLQRLAAEERLGSAALSAVIACAAEGYAFPTNLDTDPPSGSLAPETQAELMQRALDAGLSPAAFEAALDAQAARRTP